MFLLVLVAFFVACQAARITEGIVLDFEVSLNDMPAEILVEIGVRLDEQGQRNLMQVSKYYASLAEFAVANGTVPLSAWSVGIVTGYLMSNPFPSIRSAYYMTHMICHRAGPPSFVPLEDCPSALQENESSNFFKLLTLSWLPTPELLIPDFMHSRIYKAQCFWSSEPQLFWLPDKDFTLSFLEVEMSQFPEDTFASRMLAITSQPIFRHLLTPFFMANIIIPYLRGRTVQIHIAILSFIRRLSKTTHCFDPVISMIFQIIRHLRNGHDVRARYNYACQSLEGPLVGQWMSTSGITDRIKSKEYRNICLNHARTTLLMASICQFNVGEVAENMQASITSQSMVPSDHHLHLYLIGKWTVTEMALTPKGFITAAATGGYGRVALEAGMMLPPGALVEPQPQPADDDIPQDVLIATIPSDDEENMTVSDSEVCSD